MDGRKTRKSIPGEMMCGICLKLLQEPKVLSCAHSFCKHCLSQALCKSNMEELEYDEELSLCEEEKEDNKLECPICLQITVLPDECSVESLQTNMQLEDVIASLNPEEKKGLQDKMETQRRRVAELTENSNDMFTEQCKFHQKLQQHFCTECNVLVCTDCINETHNLHSCSDVSCLLLDSFSQLHGLVQPACEYMSRADEGIRKLIQDSESIESNRCACKEAVIEVFEKIHKIINQREKKVLNSIDKYVDQKLVLVAQQQKNFLEVQDQLYQNIQEIQQMLDTLLLDISILIDKQYIIDDVDEQEQNILDLENSVKNALFSSTYIGFRDDDVEALSQQLDSFITLCELYPEADTGYYSSRILHYEKEENLYHETVPQKRPSIGTTCTILEDKTVDVFPSYQVEPKEAYIPYSSSLKRSKSSPSVKTKEMLLKKMKNAGSMGDEGNAPSVPIRFDSLRAPTPILNPQAVFNRLTVSKLETVYPHGICLGENNSFIISDVKNHCLRIIANNGKFIGAIGKEGKGSGQFEEPSAVAINEKSQIIVCQRENPRIQKLTSGGKYIQKFGHKSFRGNTLGEPWGVAVGANKKLYVSDWDKSCIHIFYSTGRYDRTIGNDDSMIGESLKFPAGIAVDSSNGNIIVADRGNHCVWALKSDGSILTCIGSKGHGPGELFLPHGVAIHPDGSIVVTESGNNRISIFSQNGKFLKHFGRKGKEPGMFEHPRHVCVTSKGELVVADELNQRLQLFKL